MATVKKGMGFAAAAKNIAKKQGVSKESASLTKKTSQLYLSIGMYLDIMPSEMELN